MPSASGCRTGALLFAARCRNWGGQYAKPANRQIIAASTVLTWRSQRVDRLVLLVGAAVELRRRAGSTSDGRGASAPSARHRLARAVHSGVVALV